MADSKTLLAPEESKMANDILAMEQRAAIKFQRGKWHVILIGVGDYSNGPKVLIEEEGQRTRQEQKWPDLISPPNDIKFFYKWLFDNCTKTGFLDIEDCKRFVDDNATKDAVTEHLIELKMKRQNDKDSLANVIVVYSGHGVQKQNRTHMVDPYGEYVDLEGICQKMSTASQNTKVFCILDCCRQELKTEDKGGGGGGGGGSHAIKGTTYLLYRCEKGTLATQQAGIELSPFLTGFLNLLKKGITLNQSYNALQHAMPTIRIGDIPLPELRLCREQETTDLDVLADAFALDADITAEQAEKKRIRADKMAA